MAKPLLHHLVYQSTATVPFSERELQAILTQSRAWNSTHGLTGVLLYSNGDIMQVLEGVVEEVEYIFRKIEQDHRHGNVVKLADGSIARRNFSQWTMGFKAVDPTDFAHLKGYVNPADPTPMAMTNSEDASLHDLLSTFVTENQIRL